MNQKYYIEVDTSGNPITTSQLTLRDIQTLHPEVESIDDLQALGYVGFERTVPPILLNTFEKNIVEVMPTEKNFLGDFIQKWGTANKEFESAEAAEQARLEFLNIQKIIYKMKIDEKKRMVSRSGFTYTFPDGNTGTVQTRKSVDGNNDDGLNLSNLLLYSQVLISQNNTTSTINFRDAENAVHNMTPQQFIALWSEYHTFLYNQLQWAWGKKEEVLNAFTVEDLVSITI